ncbi:hypothetical protein RF11_06735 [Thelohanellus kitauei]|uniref:Uncharacterized protein n=1 Tax=Thelohanellus kitauei TaxID=669202 RepID=A0A0C2JGE5_THEKT|nr:hypothetical protein RF11_06735 [Thelohanellus kitauei]
MDGDLQYKISKNRHRLQQIVVIPDADVSDPESDNKEKQELSYDDLDRSSQDYQRPFVQTANIATDMGTLILTQFEKTKSENTLVISGVRKDNQQEGVYFSWRDINSPLVNSFWKDQLTEPPEWIRSPLEYFFRFFTI